MTGALLVFLGGGAGALARHGINRAAGALGAASPAATLAVNVIGSLAAGMVAAWLAGRAADPGGEPLRLLLITGVLGGFTTFSAFSLESQAMLQRGETAALAAYAAASVALSVAACAAGFATVRALS